MTDIPKPKDPTGLATPLRAFLDSVNTSLLKHGLSEQDIRDIFASGIEAMEEAKK